MKVLAKLAVHERSRATIACPPLEDHGRRFRASVTSGATIDDNLDAWLTREA